MSLSPGLPSKPARLSRAVLVRWIGTLLSLALLVYLLATQSWQEFLDALYRIPTGYFLAAFGVILVSRIAVIFRWLTLLRSAGLRISFWQAARLVFAGLFASNFLPSTVGGDVVRLGGAVRLGLDGATSAASLVMDRLVGMAGMATLLPLGLPRVWSLLAVPGASLSSALPVSTRLNSLRAKVSSFLFKSLEAFKIWARRPLALALALLFTYGHMVCLFTMTWILFRGMGESITWLSIGSLWVLSYFISLLPVAVNGLGLQEVSITYLFNHLGGVSLESALALAVVYRLLQLLSSLPGVLFLPGLLRAANRPEPYPVPPQTK